MKTRIGCISLLAVMLATMSFSGCARANLDPIGRDTGEIDSESPSGGTSDAGDQAADADQPDTGGRSGTEDEHRPGGAGARGISGWLYAQDPALADQLLAYDAKVRGQPDGENRRVRYLFPYAGDVGIEGSSYGEHYLSYDPSASAFYASRLPNTDMLPNLDSGDGNAFATWSDQDQERLAADIAAAILADPNAKGVHIDIEPFRDAHLPFYVKLRALLNGGSKILTLFTGRTSGAIYGAADILVLSGYDLGLDPPTTENYRATLGQMVRTAIASAGAAGSALLVGIPASAAWEQHATRSGNCSKDTGIKQEQWVAAALEAICPHRFEQAYLGIALWQITEDPLAMKSEPGCLRHPDNISAAIWEMLATFGPDSCR
jgi:hypothetical protein